MTTYSGVSQAEPHFIPLPTTSLILQELDTLIKLSNETVADSIEKSADSTGDWVAINFLFSIRCEDLGLQSLNKLNAIFRGWMSPSPLNTREFAVMLRGLRELIAQGL